MSEKKGEQSVVCQNPSCRARYNPLAKYERGRISSPPGDTGDTNFIALTTVPDGCCPVCMTPNAELSGRRSGAQG